MGVFPLLFATKPSSIFLILAFSATPFSSSTSISSSSSSSDELCSESESFSMRTLGKEVLRVIGAIKLNKQNDPFAGKLKGARRQKEGLETWELEGWKLKQE